MAESFTLDTSGSVGPLPAGPFNERFLTWDDIGALPCGQLAQGYIEAALRGLHDAWKHEKHLKVGDKVRVHTGEVGRVAGLDPTRSKKVHVLFRPDFGGQYFTFECDLIAPGFSDLAPATLARILQDRASFENIAVGLGLTKLGEREGRHFYAGRNNGTLQGAFAAAFPPLTFHLGDDGLIYFGEVG